VLFSCFRYAGWPAGLYEACELFKKSWALKIEIVIPVGPVSNTNLVLDHPGLDQSIPTVPTHSTCPDLVWFLTGNS
jgi:hypothetical protein